LVNLVIFDTGGRLVKRLLHQSTYPAGPHQVTWMGQDMNDRSVAAGIYFYRLRTEEFSETRRMTLVK
jgi:flagellar hook assembly protein FlgD